MDSDSQQSPAVTAAGLAGDAGSAPTLRDILPPGEIIEATPEQQAQPARCSLAPGSASAIAAGCNCPIYDNAHGEGWLCSGLFIMRDNCPIHGHKNGEPS